MVRLIQTEDGKILFTTEKVKELACIKNALKFEHPEKENIPKWTGNGGHWDGYVRFYTKYSFPTGFLSFVHKALKKQNIPFVFEKIDAFNTSQSFTPTILDRKYQKEAIDRFFKYRHGILKIPTRGGKTFVASECIKHVLAEKPYTKVLFITDTGDLFDQAIGDISKHLGITSNRIGKIREKKFELKPITVCTIQTIQSILAGAKRVKKRKDENRDEFRERIKIAIIRRKQMLQYIREVTFVIVDECHEYTSDSRLDILSKFIKAEFKLFISATPFKSESLLGNLNLRKVSGDIIYTVKSQDLKEQGFLAQEKVMLIMMEHDKDKNITVDDDNSYTEHMKQVITHNQFRNSILVNVIEICRKLNLKTLVLFQRKEHGHYIKSITGDPFISGDTVQKERTFIKNNFLRGKGKLMYASDIFKKGITLPNVEVMINCSSTLEQSLIVQKKGRILGVTKDKTKAMTIDFMDIHKYFLEHSASRLEVYEEAVGHEGIIVVSPLDNDFYNEVRNVLKTWFER